MHAGSRAHSLDEGAINLPNSPIPQSSLAVGVPCHMGEILEPGAPWPLAPIDQRIRAGLSERLATQNLPIFGGQALGFEASHQVDSRSGSWIRFSLLQRIHCLPTNTGSHSQED